MELIAKYSEPDDPQAGEWTFRLGYPQLVDSVEHLMGVIRHHHPTPNLTA